MNPKMLFAHASSVILIVCLGLAWPGLAHAEAEKALSDQNLGRLFHSPQQRAVLDELRQRNARIDREQSSSTISLQGIVRRSSGRNTVWLNGQAHSSHIPVASFGDHSARVFVGKNKTVELKVGEQIQLDTDSAAKSAQ